MDDNKPKEIVASDTKPRRYSRKAFPPYRFVPGVNPHPTEHPQGHSYGKEENLIEEFRPEKWDTDEHYLYGVDLYNYAYWWEAHEALEGLWGTVPKNDVRSHFLQGLIQISAAFLKWHMGEYKGVKSLSESGRGYLKIVCEKYPVYAGLGVRDYLQKLDRHFAKVLANHSAGGSPLKDYPLIQLKEEERGSI